MKNRSAARKVLSLIIAWVMLLGSAPFMPIDFDLVPKAGAANLAAGLGAANITTDGTSNPGSNTATDPLRVIDGIRNGDYFDWGGGQPRYYQIDLGSVQNIASVYVNFECGSMGNMNTFNVYAAETNAAPTAADIVFSGSGGSFTNKEVTVPVYSNARYIRVEFGGNNSYKLYEIEVNSASGTLQSMVTPGSVTWNSGTTDSANAIDGNPATSTSIGNRGWGIDLEEEYDDLAILEIYYTGDTDIQNWRMGGSANGVPETDPGNDWGENNDWQAVVLLNGWGRSTDAAANNPFGVTEQARNQFVSTFSATSCFKARYTSLSERISMPDKTSASGILGVISVMRG